MIKVNVESIRTFAYIKDKATWTPDLTHGEDIPAEMPVDTDWKDFEDPIVGTLIPNFFIAYFGQDLPHGDISDEEIMAKLVRLGSGYELWANTAKAVVEYIDDILFVIEEIKAPMLIKQYLDPTRNDKSLQLAMANGPFGAMTNVQSDDYPQAAHVIKEIFQLSPQILAPTLPSFPSGNVMLQLPSEIDKESEAKKEIIKLMLLLICGNINIGSTTVSNISSAPPSKGMQVVLNQPRAAQASQFADLVRMTLKFAKQQDYTNIRLSLVSIRVISKALASQILQENFATEKATSLKLEANSVEPSIFLPQRNKCLIDQELINKMKATSENIIFADSHKTKGKTEIACIGSMQNMTDFSSLCINMDTIITAICSSEEPQPILWQILLKFVSIVNNPEWLRWSKSVDAMPNLHCYCYTFLGRILTALQISQRILEMGILCPSLVQLLSSIQRLWWEH
jgi:hypothetical protein